MALGTDRSVSPVFTEPRNIFLHCAESLENGSNFIDLFVQTGLESGILSYNDILLKRSCNLVIGKI